MHLLLTHGYFLTEDAAEQRIMKPYPPLGLLYLSAYLKRAGHAVEVLDSTFLSREQFVARLAEAAPAVIGIYGTLMTRRNVLWVIARARELGGTVVLGGPEPVNYAADYLACGADVIVAGEGEETMAELLTALARGGDGLDEVRGIVHRRKDGTIAHTPSRPQVRNLDALPFPDRESIDLERYLTTWQMHHGVRSVSLITARGCPYTCRWCSHSVYGMSHRRRSPANVVAELEQIRARYDPNRVWYADDVFTINKRWLFEFAALLRERKLCFPFETISREDRLDERVVTTLAEMGCDRLWIGAESGSQSVLDKMDRRTDAVRMREMIRLLKKHGIRAGTFIMLGYEGEDWDDITATAEHLKEALPDDVLTTLAYPIKGTPYYDEVVDRLIERKVWEEGSDRDLTVAGRHTRRFYTHAQKWIAGEIAVERLRRSDPRGATLDRIKHLAYAKAHRAAMYVTRHATERRSS